MQINNFDDIIDSGDIIQRIEELKDEFINSTVTDENPDGDDPDGCTMSEDDWALGLGADGAAELVALLALEQEGEDYAPDWEYGATLVRDSYFTDYARQMAEDIGAVDMDASWPYTHIDWKAAAEALKQDYMSIDFDGETYWVR